MEPYCSVLKQNKFWFCVPLPYLKKLCTQNISKNVYVTSTFKQSVAKIPLKVPNSKRIKEKQKTFFLNVMKNCEQFCPLPNRRVCQMHFRRACLLHHRRACLLHHRLVCPLHFRRVRQMRHEPASQLHSDESVSCITDESFSCITISDESVRCITDEPVSCITG